MKNKKKICTSALILGVALISDVAFAACPAGFPSHWTLVNQLRMATIGSTTPGPISPARNGGFGLNMWVTLITRGGVVCDVAYTGTNPGQQWPLSRVISAQKANTANGLSLPGLALSTANLYSATQPGGSLFGLQESNPVNTAVAYAGSFSSFGSPDDPMIGYRVGGVNVFGGGLALYNANKVIIGAIGVSGDSSCADHNIAWRTRQALGLNHVPAGVGPNGTDGIAYGIVGGWNHPDCGHGEKAVAVAIGAGA